MIAQIKDPYDFEKVIAYYFEQQGYEVIMPPANTRGYDIELRKDKNCIAVQVKNHKAKCNVAQIQKFQNFLELPLADKFNQGWFISASGYSKPALTHVNAEQPLNLSLAIFQGVNQIDWDYNQPSNLSLPKNPPPKPVPPIEETKTKYIGVFTCKGGVGKTTVAAHLAGAFALMGHDVILLDLDPDRNLKKLFLQDIEDEAGDASIFVPAVKKNEPGTTITVLNADQWQPEDYPDVKIIICDCSPVLGENASSLVDKFDYCVIPTTLNPLGVNKHGDVIVRTFKHIRQRNSKAEMFALINNYTDTKNFHQKNQVLFSHLKQSLASYTSADSKCKLIDPDAAKVRHSNSLLYWGYHIVAGTQPQLAFKETAGRSYPRTDFLQLAEYLEEHTAIDKLRLQKA
ncbi:MAG: restriction endonuclease [Cyanobacteria bacterium J06621_8]